VSHLQEALTLATELDDFETTCRTYGNLTFVRLHAGQYDEAAQASLDGLAFLRSRGLHLGVGATLANNAASVLIMRGRYQEAEALLTDILSLYLPQGRARQLYIALAELQLRLGRFDLAKRNLLLAAEMDELAEPHLRVPSVVVQAELLLEERRFDEAIALIAATLDGLDSSEDSMMIADLCRIGLRIAADRAAQQARLPPTEDIARLANLLPAIDGDEDEPELALVACLETARAEERRARHTDDHSCWNQAAEAWIAACQPWDAAYCRFREAETAAGRRLGNLASVALLDAHTMAADLGAQPLVDATEALARRARITIGPARSTATPVAAEEGGLTPRERQVCMLVAGGATNREIATSLYISERTAAVHVSNILRKLQVKSRLEVGLIAQSWTTRDVKDRASP
jgi:DNA-binding CsgD family transcriptional regulator/tetratricopeptide (TPR) repeat protein